MTFRGSLASFSKLCFLIPIFLFGSWAEDRLAEMTLDEKIGQLFVVPACPKRGQDHVDDLLNLIHKYHVGNVIVKQSDPRTQIKFLNRLQAESKIPLLVAADAEWGLAMRMTDTIAYPRNMTLGAIQDLSLLVKLGEEIGRQAKLVGIHLNLAPVADVNNNPQNPVIHMRSFGEDPKRVAECVKAVAAGLKKGGVLACAKHFPGHGDTNVDSHRDLPVVPHSEEHLEKVEFVPFKGLEIDALMTAHLYVPAIDDQLPTSLSAACLRVARELLQFKGIIISDALNMKAIADRYTPERVAYLARAAGCDLLLYGDHIDPNVNEILRDTVPRAFASLKAAYIKGNLSLKELDATVLKILEWKEQIQPQIEDAVESLNSKEAYALKETLFQEAVTLIGENVFPIPGDTAYISFGTGDVLANAFSTPVEKASHVVIAIHQRDAITPDAIQTIEKYKTRATVCLFASPYALKDLQMANTILVGFENDEWAQQAVLNVLLGHMEPVGKLPIAAFSPQK